MASTTGEKTEQPTEKRLREARRKGQTAKSRDLTSAVLLVAAVVFVWLMGGYIGGVLQTSVKEQIEFAAGFKGQLTNETVADVFWRGLGSVFRVLTPVFLVVTIFAVLGNFLQTGTIVSFSGVAPRFEKLNPAERLRRIFLNSRSYIELAKTVLKLLISALIVGFVLWSERENIARLMAKPLDVTTAYTFGLFLEIGLKVGVALLIFGVADFFLQRFLHRRELRMTRREVREEYKETEGDPLIKARRRARHREILAQNLVSAVRESDVVIVDQANAAIALKYERGEAGAPVVTAKGADWIAAKIRQIAVESGVLVKRDVSLANALAELEVGQEIPESLYEAVAVVLQTVYTKSEKHGDI